MENKILATISGVEITESDLNAIILRYPADKRGMCNSEMGKKQLLEQMNLNNQQQYLQSIY